MSAASPLAESCAALVHPMEASCSRHWPRFFAVTLLRACAVYAPYYTLTVAVKRLFSKAKSDQGALALLTRIVDSTASSSLMVATSYALSGSLMCVVRALLGRHSRSLTFLVTLVMVTIGGRLEHSNRRRELALYWASQALETLLRLAVARAVVAQRGVGGVSAAVAVVSDARARALVFSCAFATVTAARRLSSSWLSSVALRPLSLLDGDAASVSAAESSGALVVPSLRSLLPRALLVSLAAYSAQQSLALLSSALRSRSLSSPLLGAALSSAHAASLSSALFVGCASLLLRLLPASLRLLLPAALSPLLVESLAAALTGALVSPLWPSRGAFSLALYLTLRALEALLLSAQDVGAVSSRSVALVYDTLYALAGATTHYAVFYEPYALPEGFRGFVRRTLDCAHLDDHKHWADFRAAAGAITT